MRFILVALKVFNLVFICFNKKPFKNDEKCFLFHVRCAIFVQKIFKFLYCFGHLGKQLYKKAEVNFKVC